MKVRIFKEEGDLVTVYVERNRAKENPSRAVQHVPPERVEEVVQRLVAEMRAPIAG